MSHESVPRLAVDFNELVGDDLVLLAKADAVVTADGEHVLLREGMNVVAFEYNNYGDGTAEYLFVHGVAELNHPAQNGEWTRAAKWCCRFTGGVQSLDSAP